MDVWCPFLCSYKITGSVCTWVRFWMFLGWESLTHPAQKEWALRRPTTSLTHAGHVLAPRWEAIKAASTWTKSTNPKSQEFSPSQDAAVAWWNQFSTICHSLCMGIHGHSFIALGCTIIFSVKRAMTSYKRKTGRFYSQKNRLFENQFKTFATMDERNVAWQDHVQWLSHHWHTKWELLSLAAFETSWLCRLGVWLFQTYGSQSCPFAALSRTFRTL